MNVVYVDIVFFVNFCIDYLLLFLVSKLLDMEVSFLRILSSSILGGFYSVLCRLLNLQTVAEILSLLFVMILMLVTAFGKRNFFTYTRLFVVMLLLSVLLGGAVTFVTGYFELSSLAGHELLLCAVICACVVTIMFKVLLKRVRVKRVNVKIRCNEREAVFLLLSDSGNLLVDPYNHKPVILLDKKKAEFFAEFNQKHKRLVPFSTAAGPSVAEVFTPDSVFIKCHNKNINLSASVGLVDEGRFDGSDCDGLMPESLINCL